MSRIEPVYSRIVSWVCSRRGLGVGRQTGRTFALIDNDLEHKLPPEFNFSDLEVIERHKLYSPWEKHHGGDCP